MIQTTFQVVHVIHIPIERNNTPIKPSDHSFVNSDYLVDGVNLQFNTHKCTTLPQICKSSTKEAKVKIKIRARILPTSLRNIEPSFEHPVVAARAAFWSLLLPGYFKRWTGLAQNISRTSRRPGLTHATRVICCKNAQGSPGFNDICADEEHRQEEEVYS